jgi:hypothetical protein
VTLILAVQGLGLYGDRVISDSGGERCSPIRKIVSNQALVAGFAGDFQAIIKAIELVSSGEEDPKVIAKVCAGDVDNTVEGIIVKEGRILVLDCRKVWKRPKSESFWAVGTGATTALSFLSGRLSVKSKSKLTESDIAAAYKFTARMRTDCGSKYDFLPG